MTDIEAALARLARQEQFLDVVSSADATDRFHRHLKLRPLGSEQVPLSQALNRVLAQTVTLLSMCPVSIGRASTALPFAPATPSAPASRRRSVLQLNAEILTPGVAPRLPVRPGVASLIATGGMVPRGADAVVMVEHTEARESRRQDAHRNPPSRRSRANSSPLPAAIWRAARPFSVPAKS